jgi:hypothetical protein
MLLGVSARVWPERKECGKEEDQQVSQAERANGTALGLEVSGLPNGAGGKLLVFFESDRIPVDLGEIEQFLRLS